MGHEKVGPLDRALELILSLDAMVPAPNLPDQLNGLFEDLAKPELDEPLDVVEGSIWALWCSHPDDSAVQQMERVIGGLSQGRFDAAERLLDGLVRDYPDWAEAWNKRATLYFLLDRDDESVADIEETLKLEPRHFGALGGFGQICLRRDEPVTARIAFEKALEVNPHLEGVREIVHELGAEYRPVVN
ncbi:MAG: tetratricopeptide repeat protein [Pseudomonadota bacterium]|nr:tetratricopeptide repeat protein [Pseudomonadota bacterium]